MKLLLIISLLLFLFSCSEKIKAVKDGDTIVLSSGEVIRIAEIDAPELSQFYGKEAKAFTERHLLGQSVKVKRKGKDKYKRTIAEVEVNGASFAWSLVSEGLAHVHPKYVRNEALIKEYYSAQANRRGLFAYNWITPSHYRKLNHK